jgi:hypothetical protein
MLSSTTMTEESDNLQRLLRLKRHEHPEDMDEFTANLIAKLHVRQREDYLKQSSFSLFLDRVSVWFESFSAPKLAMATATALALIVGALNMWHSVLPTSGNVGVPVSFSPRRDMPVNPELLHHHYDGGLGRLEDVSIPADGPKRPFTVMPQIEGVNFEVAPEPQAQPKPVQ